jgi:hypothetical protein
MIGILILSLSILFAGALPWWPYSAAGRLRHHRPWDWLMDQNRLTSHLEIKGATGLEGDPATIQVEQLVASLERGGAYSGAAALSLVSQGRLSLDDIIAQRLPRLPRAWGSVTLRQLLNHTSGLPDFPSSEAARQAISASPTVPPRPDQLLDFVKDEPLVFAPGSKYAYSNSDNVAGRRRVRNNVRAAAPEADLRTARPDTDEPAGRPGPADAVRPRLRRSSIGPAGGSEPR